MMERQDPAHGLRFFAFNFFACDLKDFGVNPGHWTVTWWKLEYRSSEICG
jgi:hypothetical protein